MAKRVRDYERVWVSIPKDFDAELERLSKRMVVSKSMLMNMSAQAGLKLIMRSIAPEETFTADQWADLAVAYGQKTGTVPQLPVPTRKTSTRR